MAYDPLALIRAIHIFSAALWVGAGIFLAFILGPSIAKAGPGAGPLMMVALRRGGFAWFFLTFGALTILAGGYLYTRLGYAQDPFGSGPSALITLGATLAILAFLHGAASIAPTERKLAKIAKSIPPGGMPTPEQGAEFGRLGAKQGKHSAIGQVMVFIAFLCMILSRVV